MYNILLLSLKAHWAQCKGRHSAQMCSADYTLQTFAIHSTKYANACVQCSAVSPYCACIHCVHAQYGETVSCCAVCTCANMCTWTMGLYGDQMFGATAQCINGAKIDIFLIKIMHILAYIVQLVCALCGVHHIVACTVCACIIFASIMSQLYKIHNTNVCNAYLQICKYMCARMIILGIWEGCALCDVHHIIAWCTECACSILASIGRGRVDWTLPEANYIQPNTQIIPPRTPPPISASGHLILWWAPMLYSTQHSDYLTLCPSPNQC